MNILTLYIDFQALVAWTVIQCLNGFTFKLICRRVCHSDFLWAKIFLVCDLISWYDRRPGCCGLQSYVCSWWNVQPSCRGWVRSCRSVVAKWPFYHLGGILWCGCCGLCWLLVQCCGRQGESYLCALLDAAKILSVLVLCG